MPLRARRAISGAMASGGPVSVTASTSSSGTSGATARSGAGSCVYGSASTCARSRSGTASPAVAKVKKSGRWATRLRTMVGRMTWRAAARSSATHTLRRATSAIRAGSRPASRAAPCTVSRKKRTSGAASAPCMMAPSARRPATRHPAARCEAT